ncbi:heptaprenyl diphosphate synthase component 1 [Lysinibacillus sp. LZ02]|uniref:heptaprenyl diphosphate synthase component 1 n=1 Tax=Lysinibacillus sp. LZ02 TaxID=3420668 RepID=UPI003D36DADB
MDATTISQAVEQLKTTILDSIRHNVLLKYTGTPLLNEQQLFFLLLPKLNGEAWDDEVTKSAVTVGIVHSSLAEHDKIYATNAVSKEQQLTVLSGDYYSGRYYQLLAQTGNIELIRKLSEAIVERCEQEMTVYEHERRTFQEWIHSIATIETALIERFFSVYQYDSYKQVMQQTLTIARLNRELMSLPQGATSLYIERMAMSLEGQPIAQVLEQEITERKRALNATLATSTYSETLQQIIVEMVS